MKKLILSLGLLASLGLNAVSSDSCTTTNSRLCTKLVSKSSTESGSDSEGASVSDEELAAKKFNNAFKDAQVQFSGNMRDSVSVRSNCSCLDISGQNLSSSARSSLEAELDNMELQAQMM